MRFYRGQIMTWTKQEGPQIHYRLLVGP
ncbi:hypothetical protein NC653_008997 [Populus alba x Populus x berolinensis]|uniref:Uncharacterized protein n=1 Tax=Populus alba x Populus x berolinensis TaxID=444605 RepID=A0AAD6R890_9ROSI|nr:hypothetical protein NC653_008997 [Populus alba x Populus x berolinensis]